MMTACPAGRDRGDRLPGRVTRDHFRGCRSPGADGGGILVIGDLLVGAVLPIVLPLTGFPSPCGIRHTSERRRSEAVPCAPPSPTSSGVGVIRGHRAQDLLTRGIATTACPSSWTARSAYNLQERSGRRATKTTRVSLPAATARAAWKSRSPARPPSNCRPHPSCAPARRGRLEIGCRNPVAARTGDIISSPERRSSRSAVLFSPISSPSGASAGADRSPLREGTFRSPAAHRRCRGSRVQRAPRARPSVRHPAWRRAGAREEAGFRVDRSAREQIHQPAGDLRDGRSGGKRAQRCGDLGRAVTGICGMASRYTAVLPSRLAIVNRFVTLKRNDDHLHEETR